MAIEVDGGIHRDKPVADAWRTRILACCGVRIVRFVNEEVVGNPGLSGLLRERLLAFNSPPGPLSFREGEEEAA